MIPIRAVWTVCRTGLDYIVQQAGQYGIRLVLTLGNLWPAYVGPEVFLAAANGGLAGGRGQQGLSGTALADKLHVGCCCCRSY